MTCNEPFETEMLSRCGRLGYCLRLAEGEQFTVPSGLGLRYLIVLSGELGWVGAGASVLGPQMPLALVGGTHGRRLHALVDSVVLLATDKALDAELLASPEARRLVYACCARAIPALADATSDRALAHAVPLPDPGREIFNRV